MKKLMLLAIALCTGVMTAQLSSGPSFSGSAGATFDSFNNKTANLGYASGARALSNKIDGTPYLYDGWDNNAVVVSKNGKKFRLDDVNFNAQRNRFEHKISKDSIYTFNFRSVDQLTIANRTFKSINVSTLKRDVTMQYVGGNADFEIYRHYRVEIEAGSANPMRGQSKDKYRLKKDYYLKKGDDVTYFSAKKSNVLKLMGDKANTVKAYAKKNRLSYSDDKELGKILSYYSTL